MSLTDIDTSASATNFEISGKVDIPIEDDFQDEQFRATIKKSQANYSRT